MADTTNAAATAADFDRWEAAAAKMSKCELAFAIQDTRRAADACQHSELRSGRYSDEHFTYCAESRRREAGVN